MSEELRLEIDENRLDDEWIGQPRLYYEYASKLADAKRDLEEAKAEAEVTKANLAQLIRTDPEKFGLVKVTEKSVEEAVAVQNDLADALREVREARHLVDVLTGAVASLDHRKKALEKLVELFLANYYSSPKASGRAGEAMDEKEKRAVRRGGRRTKR
jgi:hypothetical protein